MYKCELKSIYYDKNLKLRYKKYIKHSIQLSYKSKIYFLFDVVFCVIGDYTTHKLIQDKPNIPNCHRGKKQQHP